MSGCVWGACISMGGSELLSLLLTSLSLQKETLPSSRLAALPPAFSTCALPAQATEYKFAFIQVPQDVSLRGGARQGAGGECDNAPPTGSVLCCPGGSGWEEPGKGAGGSSYRLGEGHSTAPPGGRRWRHLSSWRLVRGEGLPSSKGSPSGLPSEIHLTGGGRWGGEQAPSWRMWAPWPLILQPLPARGAQSGGGGLWRQTLGPLCPQEEARADAVDSVVRDIQNTQCLLNVEHAGPSCPHVTLQFADSKGDVGLGLVKEGLVMVEPRKEKQFQKVVRLSWAGPGRAGLGWAGGHHLGHALTLPLSCRSQNT